LDSTTGQSLEPFYVCKGGVLVTGVAGIEMWEPRHENYHCELIFGSHHNGTSVNSPHTGLVLMVGFLSF
jgi:hypothetical protein